jgi:hypothetical protein
VLAGQGFDDLGVGDVDERARVGLAGEPMQAIERPDHDHTARGVEGGLDADDLALEDGNGSRPGRGPGLHPYVRAEVDALREQPALASAQGDQGQVGLVEVLFDHDPGTGLLRHLRTGHECPKLSRLRGRPRGQEGGAGQPPRPAGPAHGLHLRKI